MTQPHTDFIPDLSALRVVVTGANSGIGFEAGRELLRHGAQVILACRSPEKAESAHAALLRELPDCRAEMRSLDLASLDSVRGFAAEIDGPLDLLINNAGVMAIPRRTTADGFEMQIGTNHFGHFALTGLLLPNILQAAARARVEGGPAPRIVTVSSQAHRIGRLNLEDINSERSYNKWAAYGQSKLANLLFMHELAARLKDAGVSALSVACHPGYAATNLQSVGPKMEGAGLMGWITDLGNKVFAQSAAAGAQPTLFAACAEAVRSGEYFGPSGLMEMRGSPERTGCTGAAKDTSSMRGLWELSEQLTAVRYDFAPQG